jgi:hypothetical protein
MRTRDVDKIIAATNQYSDNIVGFYPYEWVLNKSNIALINDKDDIGLLEFLRPGVFYGHYFFWSRGREAVTAGKEFLREAFTEYDVKAIQGLTPLTNLGARWMNKQLGFKSQGVTPTIADTCEIVIMTKQDWEAIYE